MARPALALLLAAAALSGCGGDEPVTVDDAAACFRDQRANVEELPTNSFSAEVEVDRALRVSPPSGFGGGEAFIVVFTASDEAAERSIAALKKIGAGEQKRDEAYTRYGATFVFWATDQTRRLRRLSDGCLLPGGGE